MIHAATRNFPREERALVSQMLQSARSVPALLAEAWGRRQYRRALNEKLSQALGEAMETEAWIDCARRCGYLSEELSATMIRDWHQIGGMIRRMMQQAPAFAGKGPPH